MKNLFRITCMLSLILISHFSLLGQDCFQATYNLHIKMAMPENDEIKALGITMPDQHQTLELIANQSESIFKESSKQEGQEIEAQEGMMIKFEMPADIYYLDLDENKYLRKTTLAGMKAVTVKDDIQTLQFEFTGKNKKLGSKTLLEATFNRGDNTYSLWFDPTQKVKHNILGITGLPGLIYEMETDGGQLKWELIDMKTTDSASTTIDKSIVSTKKTMSEEAYQRKNEQVLKNLGAEDGIIIRTITE